MIGTLLVLAAVLSAEPRVTTWAVPDQQIPTEIVRHGNELWFVSWANWRAEAPKYEPYLGRVDTQGKFTMKQLPADHMPGLTTHAPDGTLWLSDGGQPLLWRVTKDGKVDSVNTGVRTQGIAFGPDGALWCTSPGRAAIIRFSTDGKQTGSWDVPDVDTKPMTSAAAAAAPPASAGPTPIWIAAGPDRALWFTEPNRGRIGRIDTKGTITMYRSPMGVATTSSIVVGPDGAVWFSTRDVYLGRITTKGEVMTTRVQMRPTSLAVDRQGRIWFAEGARAGFIDKELEAYDFAVPGAKSIRALAAGPDGAMYFVDQAARTVGRIELPAAAAPRRP